MSWFDMSKKTPWEQKIEKRTAAIGFLTRANALRELTPAEKAVALAVETKSWQATLENGWKNSWTVSAEYNVPRGTGRNLNAWEERPKIDLDRAMVAYMNTPMEIVGKFADAGIDLGPYQRKSLIQKVTAWFKNIFTRKESSGRSFKEWADNTKEKK